MLKSVVQLFGLFAGVVGGSIGVNLLINKFKRSKQTSSNQLSNSQQPLYNNNQDKQYSMYDNISQGLSSTQDNKNKKI